MELVTNKCDPTIYKLRDQRRNWKRLDILKYLSPKLLKLLLTPVPSIRVSNRAFKEQSKAKYFHYPAFRHEQNFSTPQNPILHVANLKNKQHLPYSPERFNIFSSQNWTPVLTIRPQLVTVPNSKQSQSIWIFQKIWWELRKKLSQSNYPKDLFSVPWNTEGQLQDLRSNPR